MRNFLGDVEDPISLSVLFNVTTSLKFYEHSLVEITVENGNKLVNEVTKLIHNTITKKENGKFSLQLETFDRELKNRSFSISEKVYAGRIADIIDDITIIANEAGKIQSISNLEEIQQKVEHTINKLSESYKGEKVEKNHQYLRSFYKSESLVIHDLKMYNQLGLLLNPYYGNHKSNKNRLHQLRYINFMENTVVNIEEQSKLKKFDAERKEAEIEIKGTMITPIYKSMFERQMGIKEITYDSKNDNPTLDKYDGLIIFNTDTGEVKSASIDIEFTFGSNYSKKIKYQLKEIL